MKVVLFTIFCVATTQAIYIDQSATLDFPSTIPTGSNVLTMDLSGRGLGVNPGYMVALGVPNSCASLGGVYQAWVSATNTVSIRFTNTNGIAIPVQPSIDPPSAIFRVRVFNDDV